MNRVVWKYPLGPGSIDDFLLENFAVEMPEGADVLTVQLQRGIPTLWALVDPDRELSKRPFAFVATGENPREDLGDYIDTVQLATGLVLHLFEVES